MDAGMWCMTGFPGAVGGDYGEKSFLSREKRRGYGFLK
jgi:hypothetical protein